MVESARVLGPNEWYDFFSGLTLEAFNAGTEVLLSPGEVPHPYLLVGLARKLLDHGHFSEGLEVVEREALAAKAEEVIAMALAGAPRQAAQIAAAWEVSKERCHRFGYTSGSVWEVSRPHRVFRADNDFGNENVDSLEGRT